jgi:hypothetical protein
MFTTTSVNATDDEKTFTDTTGDVFDFQGDQTVTFPEITDIDMHYITYTQEDEKVTIEIEFVDIIEDSEELFITAALTTSDYDYEISYLFGELEGLYGIDRLPLEEDVILNGFGSKKLSFKFNLIDNDEDYKSLLIWTMKISLTEDFSYIDMYPNFDDFPDVNIQGPTEGEVGKSIQFYSSASGGTPPYTYEWDFDGDGETDSDEQNPKYAFSKPDEYEVMLTILDSAGNLGINVSVITISSTSQSDSNDESGAITFIILIAFIIIVGVAAVVFIIRR